MNLNILYYILFSSLIFISPINIIVLLFLIIYLIIKLFRKEQIASTELNKKEIFSLEKKNKIKFKKFLKDKSEHKIQEIIILENENIITIENYIEISYYEKNNLNYKKVFNNLNKNYFVFGLCKLRYNRACFLSFYDKDNMHFYLFNNETFISKEKEIKMKKPISNVKSKNIFPINDNTVTMISKYEFYIFNVDLLEIQTIYSLGLICNVLPFNIKKNYMDYQYEYFAIIFFENSNFYLKIYFVNSDYHIKESDKIDLFNYFDAIKLNNAIISYFINENNKTEEDKGEYYYRSHHNYHHFMINFEKIQQSKEVFIYLNYELDKDNKITFKIYSIVPETNIIYKKYMISLKPIVFEKINFK